MSYPIEIRAEIFARHQQGLSVKQLSAEYGISERTVYRWVKEQLPLANSEHWLYTFREYDLLRQRVIKQQNIIAILKEVCQTSKFPLKDKLSEMEALYGQFDVTTLCEALDVSRGTFYNYIFRGKRDDAWYNKRREKYRTLVQEIFDEHRQAIGADKIEAILKQRGHKVSDRFVASIMRELGIASVRTNAKKNWVALQPKKNIVRRQFQADAPNLIWVSDVTCFKINGHYYFVCVIIDLFSRMVIAYKVSRKNSTQLITSTFKTAYAKRNPKNGLVFHSDQGSQYTSNAFRKLLSKRSVTQSFSHPGSPHDNAVAESFFSSFKKEELYRRDYHSESDFRHAVDSYVSYYNEKRPHRTLGNLTPKQVEAKYVKRPH